MQILISKPGAMFTFSKRHDKNAPSQTQVLPDAANTLCAEVVTALRLPGRLL
jgi:hypothetical protein